ncbi:MAG: hypothetical protein A2Y33_10175 [Spirochaetes bacterium GWF1_51_8]|nr:MAG: hypothetical protein A2Y33_10175 [Spirochaetes bacterium GWF1_51_8]
MMRLLSITLIFCSAFYSPVLFFSGKESMTGIEKEFYLESSFYGANYLHLKWNEWQDSAVYTLSCSAGSNMEYETIYNGSGTEFIHQGLKPNTVYYYRLSVKSKGKSVQLIPVAMRTLPEVIQFGGIPVKGFISNLTEKPMTKFPEYGKTLLITSSVAGNFSADSFFMVKGTNYSSGQQKIGFVLEDPGKSNITWGIMEQKGYFEKMIFLRYGPGNYTLKIMKKSDPADYWRYLSVQTVTNINPEDFRYLMPSESAQSFDPLIRAITLQLCGKETNPSNIAVLLHDYIIKTVFFDNEVYEGFSKPEDALSVLKRGSAVCAGYAHLYSAMLRVMNIPVKFIAGKTGDSVTVNHAWNEVWWGNGWHIIAVSWDDPLTNGHSDYPDGDNLRWKYFNILPSPILIPVNEKE